MIARYFPKSLSLPLCYFHDCNTSSRASVHGATKKMKNDGRGGDDIIIITSVTGVRLITILPERPQNRQKNNIPNSVSICFFSFFFTARNKMYDFCTTMLFFIVFFVIF